MKASYVSSHAITQALRYSMLRVQSDLVNAQKESATGRVADVGLALGVATSRTVSLARDMSRLEAISDSNNLVAARLTSTQDALQQIADRADDFRSTLTASVGGNVRDEIVKIDAAATMATLRSILNTSSNGEYLFAGINTDVQPFADFSDPNSLARSTFDQSFVTHFGIAPTNPAANNITAAQMEDFLTNVVEPQFFGSTWNPNWSTATDEAITARISLNETAETSVSANISGVRKIAMAAAISMALLGTEINAAAASAIADRSLVLVAEGSAEIADQKARTGLVEQRVAAATERLSMQVDLFERTIQDLEGVDPYEAATRVSALLTQIETSYALTARIQQLSLLRFLA
jgi:flagellar hook-associated protein 3 FlgL